MKYSINKRIFAIILSAVVAVSSSFLVMGAEEGAGEGETEATEAELEEGGEMPEGEEPAADETAGEGEDAQALVMSGLQADNGRFIAASFPDDLMPEGFHKSGCTYKDQRIEIAYMDSDAAGDVVLAYLADEDGGNGDFYLCDIITAQMSDFVQIKNGAQGYIIVLNPGDNIVAPAGFTRAELKYGDKTVTAWMLPQEESVSLKEDFFTVNVQASPITTVAMGGVGDLLSPGSNDGEAPKEDKEEAGTKQEEEKKEEPQESTDANASSEEDGSRLVSAPASDFFMVYAIDNTGTVGFYLYDKVQKTYQRYVALSSADGAGAAGYKKTAQIRLYIIAALAFVVIILLFVMVNMMISRRDEDEEEYESEEREDFYERQRKRREAAEAARRDSRDRDRALSRERESAAVREDSVRSRDMDSYDPQENYEDAGFSRDAYGQDEYAPDAYGSNEYADENVTGEQPQEMYESRETAVMPEITNEAAQSAPVADAPEEEVSAARNADNRIRRRPKRSTPKKLHDRSEMRDLMGIDEEEDYRAYMSSETKVIPPVQDTRKVQPAPSAQSPVRRMPPTQGPARKPSRTVTAQSQPQPQGVPARVPVRQNQAYPQGMPGAQGRGAAPSRGGVSRQAGAGTRPVRNAAQPATAPKKRVEVDDDLDFEFLDV